MKAAASARMRSKRRSDVSANMAEEKISSAGLVDMTLSSILVKKMVLDNLIGVSSAGAVPEVSELIGASGPGKILSAGKLVLI